MDKTWWKHTIVYQIYPRSFQDSNGDGVGDLKGIQSRLDHLRYIGVETVWLSPIYKSPFKDFGYDVSDYIEIDPIFGTLGDFDDLIKEMHEKGMKLIMDFIPNHTSDLHHWFRESRKSRTNEYSDYYIWSDGKIMKDGKKGPPNNWVSVFGGSAWNWDNKRRQYYFHQFLPEQPDLNYRNPKVRKEMEEVLDFWLLRGVDGFRVDAINFLFEVEDISLDEPITGRIHTVNQPETHEVIGEWRKVLNQYEQNTGKVIVMITEMYGSLSETMKYYHSGADMPFNFKLMKANKCSGGKQFKELIEIWMTEMPEGKWPNFVLSNHDQPRMVTKKGQQYASALNMLLLTLPGTPTTYYGEEIGMENIKVSFKDTQDPFGINMGPNYSRDPCRSPMQWDQTSNAGFSSKKPWLPVHSDFITRNVQVQKCDPQSPLNAYAAISKLRKEPAFRTSQLMYVAVNNNIISYVRNSGNQIYLIAINLGFDASQTACTVSIGDKVYSEGVVCVSIGDTLRTGWRINLQYVSLQPGQGFIADLTNETRL